MEIPIACPGYEIAADWYQGSSTNKILLVLPGFNSSKARQKAHAEAMLAQTGTSVLTVDFSGHGSSPFALKDTRPAQHFLELICVFDWLKEKYPEAVISVSGSSYGGFLAVQLTKYREFSNLILRAPAIYKPNAFYDLWSVRLDNPARYDKQAKAYRSDASALKNHPLLGRAAAFKGRTLVVVHEHDEVVPKETADAYIAAFNADSFIAKGFRHAINSAEINEAELASYQDKIATWLNEA